MDCSIQLSHLERLDQDSLRAVLVEVTATSIGRLWLSGSRRIRHLIASGAIMRFAFSPDETLPCDAWPPLLSQIPIIELDFSFNSQDKIAFCLESMRPTLKSLRFSNLAGTHRDYFVESYKPSLRTIFPELHTLEIPLGFRQVVPNFEASLPATLTKLDISSAPGMVSNRLIQALPYLTYLDGSCHIYFMKTEIPLPPGLETLRLKMCPTMRIFALIAPLQSLKTLSISRGVRGATAPSFGWASTLPSLPSQVTDLDLALHPDVGISGFFFSTLPSSLTRLIYTHTATGELPAEELMRARFPSGLTDLQLSTLTMGDITTIDLFSSLPPHIRNLRLTPDIPMRLGAAEVAHLPSSLTGLYGQFTYPVESLDDLPASMGYWLSDAGARPKLQDMGDNSPITNLKLVTACSNLTSKSIRHLLAMIQLSQHLELSTNLLQYDPISEGKTKIVSIVSPASPSSCEPSSTNTPKFGSPSQLRESTSHAPAFSFSSSQVPIAPQSSNDSLAVFKRHKPSPTASESTTPSPFSMSSSSSRVVRAKRGPHSSPISSAAPSAFAPAKQAAPLISTPKRLNGPMRCMVPHHVKSWGLIHPTDIDLEIEFPDCLHSRSLSSASTLQDSFSFAEAFITDLDFNIRYLGNPRSPWLRSVSDFPTTLVTLKITSFEVDPGIFFKLARCKRLENLEVSSIGQIPLVDEHISALPDSLHSLRVRGSPTNLTVEGYRSLPTSLSVVQLPISPEADAEMDKLETKSIDKFWPKRCQEILFISKGVVLKTLPCWLTSLKMHRAAEGVVVQTGDGGLKRNT